MAELQEELGVGNRTYLKKKFVESLLNASLLRMTKPDKPTARDQKYVVTDNGLD
jgi:ATP-dependent DNA helicase RecG